MTADSALSATRAKVMLIDGHALVHRAFHALPELTTTSGELTNAVYGWAQMVIKAIDDLQPTHAIVAFDLPQPTFRHLRYTEYKANRAHMPRPLALQFDRVRQVAEAFHMPIVSAPGFEADDVLGSLAKQAELAGADTVIVTGDLDTLQLVNEHITVMTSKRQMSETIMYDVPGVYSRFGITPKQLPDLKGLVGDSSDNIPGIRGVGEKSAAKWLQQYGSLEGIYEHIDEIPGRYGQLLRDNRDLAFESRTLATIVEAPVELDLTAAVLADLDMPRLIALFRELEFRQLIQRLQELYQRGNGSLASATPAPSTPSDQLSLFDAPVTGNPGEGQARQVSLDLAMQQPAGAPTKVEIVTDKAGLDDLLRVLEAAGDIAISIEAEGRHNVDADLVGIALAVEEGAAFYVPLGHRAGAQLEPIATLLRLAPIFEDADKWKIGYDLKQSSLILGSHGIALRGLASDVMLAGYLESSSGRLSTLDALSAQFLDIEIPNRELLLGKGKAKLALHEVGIDLLANYAGIVADVIFRLSPVCIERLTNRGGLLGLYQDLEMPLIDVLAAMERQGVMLDVGLLAEMSGELAVTLKEIESRIYERVGHEFNINSPPQLGEILFVEMKFPKGRRTKTGFSTDNEVLEKLRDHDPVVGDVLEYRQLSKLKGTYVDALPALISPRDGKLHAEFNQAVASTGRLSSSNPNLQNIPIRTEIGHKIRRAVIPSDPNSVILAADYSQIELRVLAHLSNDARLVEAFTTNQDIHSVTAAAVWNIKQSEVSPDQRRIAKVVNFGIAYGIGEQRLAFETGLSRAEAAAFIDAYRKTYAGVTDFMNETREAVAMYGEVLTLLGRVRKLPEIHSQHPGLRQAAERAAINMPVQGTAADIMKLAMIDASRAMKERGVESVMILQVHDELVFETPKDEVDQMASLVFEAMSKAMELAVPLGVDIRTGPNWGQLTPHLT